MKLGAMEEYGRLRKELDEAGYREIFPLDSLPLVKNLWTKLSDATIRLHKLTKQHAHYKQIATELECGVAPFKEETVRLIRESSSLRMNLIQNKETFEETLRACTSKERALETEISDLKLIIKRFIQKLNTLEGNKTEVNMPGCGGNKNKGGQQGRGKGQDQQRSYGMEMEGVIACNACPFCVRVRNYVEFDGYRNPQPQDYLKIADGRIEALQMQIRTLKATENDNTDLVGALKRKVEERDREIERLRKYVKVRPGGGTNSMGGVEGEIPTEDQRSLEYQLKSARLQIDLLLRRNLTLERKFKSAILEEHTDFMNGTRRTPSERELIRELSDFELEKPTHDEISLLEKLKTLENQFSNCCKEKAELKAKLEKCESQRSRKKNKELKGAEASDAENDYAVNENGMFKGKKALKSQLRDKEAEGLRSRSASRTDPTRPSLERSRGRTDVRKTSQRMSRDAKQSETRSSSVKSTNERYKSSKDDSKTKLSKEHSEPESEVDTEKDPSHVKKDKLLSKDLNKVAISSKDKISRKSKKEAPREEKVEKGKAHETGWDEATLPIKSTATKTLLFHDPDPDSNEDNKVSKVTPRGRSRKKFRKSVHNSHLDARKEIEEMETEEEEKDLNTEEEEKDLDTEEEEDTEETSEEALSETDDSRVIEIHRRSEDSERINKVNGHSGKEVRGPSGTPEKEIGMPEHEETHLRFLEERQWQVTVPMQSKAKEVLKERPHKRSTKETGNTARREKDVENSASISLFAKRNQLHQPEPQPMPINETFEHQLKEMERLQIELINAAAVGRTNNQEEKLERIQSELEHLKREKEAEARSSKDTTDQDEQFKLMQKELQRLKTAQNNMLALKKSSKKGENGGGRSINDSTLENKLADIQQEIKRLEKQQENVLQRSSSHTQLQDKRFTKETSQDEQIKKIQEEMARLKREQTLTGGKNPKDALQEKHILEMQKEIERLKREEKAAEGLDRDAEQISIHKEMERLKKEHGKLVKKASIQGSQKHSSKGTSVNIQIANVQEEMERLKREQQHLESGSRDPPTSATLRDALVAQESELKALKDQNYLLRMDQRAANASTGYSRDAYNVNRLESELLAMKKEVERLKQEKEEAARRSEGSRESYNVQKLENELESMKRENERLTRKQMEFGRPAKGSQSQDFSNDAYALQIKEQEMEMMRIELERLKKERDQDLAKKTGFSEDVYGSRDRQAREDQLEAYEREIERLRRQLADATATSTHINSSSASLFSKPNPNDSYTIQKQKEQLEGLQKELARLKLERDEALAKAESLQEEKTKQQRQENSQYLSKYGSKDAAKSEAGSLHADNFQMAQKLRDYAAKEQELEREISRLKTNLRNVDRECDEMRTALNRESEKRSRLQQDHQQLQKTSASSVHTSISAAVDSREMEHLRSALSAARKNVDIISKERDDALKSLQMKGKEKSPPKWPSVGVAKSTSSQLGPHLESFEASQRLRSQAAKEQELEREIAHLRSSLRALDSDKDEMRVELDRKDERLARMRSDCESHMTELSRLKLQLKNAELEMGQSFGTVKDAEREGIQLRHTIDSLRRDVEMTAKERDEAVKDCRRLAGAISKEEIERKSLNLELTKSSKEADGLRKQVQKYIEEVRRIEDLLIQKEEEMESLIEHYRGLSFEKSTLETQRTSLEREAHSIRDHVRDAVDANISLKNQLSSQNNLLVSYEEQLEQLSLRVSSLENALANAAHKDETAQSDLKATRDLIFTLETKMDGLKLELANCESDRNKLRAEVEEERIRCEMLEDQLREEMEKEKKLEEVILAVRESESVVERSTHDLSREKNHLADQLNSLQNRTETLNAEISKFRLRSIELQNELDRTKRQLQSEKYERETALAELRRVQKLLNSTSTNTLINTALGMGTSGVQISPSSALSGGTSLPFSPMSEAYLDSPLVASTSRDREEEEGN